MKHIGFLVLLLLALCISACSTINTGALNTPERGASRQFAVASDEGVGTFVPDFTVSEDMGGAVVEITAENAVDLGAAYVHLSYDTSRYTPERVEFGQFLGDQSQVLTLALTDIAHEVPVGIAQIAASGVLPVRGSGVLATVYFRAEPFTRARSASKAPSGHVNSVDDLAIISQTALSATLRWTEHNVGDYDNNSQVNISDLTPLGVLFGQSVASASDPTWAAMVDGDGNGVINIADITPIGANFGNKIDGYILYTDAPGTTPYGSGITADRAAFYSDAKVPVVYQITASVLTGQQMDFSVKPADADNLDSPGPQSNIAQIIIEDGAPAKPALLTATASAMVGVGNIKLDWVKSTSADANVTEIWRKLTSGDETTWTKVTEVANSIQTFTDSGLADDSFDYRICARDFTDLVSPWEPETAPWVSATPYIIPPPSPPENVAANPHPTEGSAIKVIWSPPADDSATGYKVYRKAPGENDFTVVANKNNKFDTEHADLGLTAGQTYEYYVTSFANPLESVPSPTVNAQPSAEANIQIISLTTDKTTHVKTGAELASNMTVTTDLVPDSVDWSAPSGDLTPAGSTATWKPGAGAVAEVVTITCTVHKGSNSANATLKMYVTDETIKTAFGNAGAYVDFSNLPSNEVPNAPYRPFSYYVTQDHVILVNAWGLW